MNNIKLNRKNFKILLSKAKYQFILESKDCIYFIALGREVHYSDTSFVAHNETKNTIEIISYNKIIKGIVDGEKYVFKD